MSVERVRRNGNDFPAAAVFVQRLCFGVGGHQEFVVDVLARHEHQGNSESSFVGQNIFLCNRISMALHGRNEGSPRFIRLRGCLRRALLADAAKGVGGNFESMGNNLSRRKMTASAASPLEKRYCLW